MTRISVHLSIIADFGVKGELITLPKHFGRRLISQDKAVYASPENIEEFATVHKVVVLAKSIKLCFSGFEKV